MPAVQLRDAGELLASIPALLGYVPHSSFVLLGFSTQSRQHFLFRVMARLNLTDAFDHAQESADHLARGFTSTETDRLIAVIVDDSNRFPEPIPFRTTLSPLFLGLVHHGLEPNEILFLTRFAPGTPWACLADPSHTGILPDPATAQITAECISNGQQILNCRDDLSRMFTPAPAHERDRLTPLLKAAIDAVTHEDTLGDRRALRARLDRLDQAVRSARDGDFPDNDIVLADLIAAFASLQLRDAMLTPIAEPDAAAATETLWLRLWRLAPDECAENLAATIASSAYLRGDGPRALEALRATKPTRPLTRMLAAIVTNYIPPDKLIPVFREAAHNSRAQLNA